MKNTHASCVFFLLTCILVSGFLLRINHISAVKNVDEPNIVKRAVQFADGKFHIQWYNWPAQSLIRIDGVLFRLAQPFIDIEQSETESAKRIFQHNENVLYTLARVVTVLCGVASIYLLFLIGKALNNYATGLLAAFFLATNYLHTVNSHYATPDVPMTFALLLSVYIAMRIFAVSSGEIKRERWFYILGGAVCGFAVATKYTGALALVPLCMVFIYKCIVHKRKGIVQATIILLFGLGALVAHTLFNPFFFVDIPMIIHHLFFEATSQKIGADWGGLQHPHLRNALFYINSSLSWNGTIISLLSYCTIFYGFLQLRKKEWRLFNGISFFFLIALFGLSMLSLHWARWAVPFSPLIDILAAYGIVKTCTRLYNRISHKKLFMALSVVFITIISIPQIILSYAATMSFGGQTTSQAMAAYITEHLPTGSSIVQDTYNMGRFLDKTQFTVRTHMGETSLYDTPLSTYRDSGVDYIVVKPKLYAFAQKEPKKYSKIIELHTSLKTQAKKIITIRGSQGILARKRDHQVYAWLLRHPLSQIIQMQKGPSLELYDISL